MRSMVEGAWFEDGRAEPGRPRPRRRGESVIYTRILLGTALDSD